MAKEKGVSVYERTGRSSYYVSYPDPITSERVHRATQYHVTDPEGRRKAFDYAFGLARLEENADSKSERWASWVEPHLNQRYKRQPRTLDRYLTCWKHVRLFLHERGVHGPRMVTLQTVRDYLDWRVARVKKSGRSVTHNTAIVDIKMFQIVLNEAVRRGWIATNPCRELGVTRIAAKKKREITDDEMERIIAALDALVAAKPDRAWMRTAWEVARWQGCRLAETRIDIARQVNFADGTITFYGKGRNGQPHVFETMLHPQLRPFLEDMVRRKQKVTLNWPPMGKAPTGAASKLFRFFFDDLGLPDISFHCTRVTVITKLARSQVPISQAMAFVGHADEEVHRIYQKLKARDLGQAALAVSYTRAPASNPGSTGPTGTP